MDIIFESWLYLLPLNTTLAGTCYFINIYEMTMRFFFYLVL